MAWVGGNPAPDARSARTAACVLLNATFNDSPDGVLTVKVIAWS